MLVWWCVAVRIVANPLSNAFQKSLTGRSADPLFVVGVTHALLTAACLPLLIAAPRPSPTFWIDMGVGAILCIAGNVLIVEALKRSDLSVLGPINAWKPVVGLVPGAALLKEWPGPIEVAGIALVVAGSLVLVDRGSPATGGRAGARLIGDRGVQLRFAALVLSATEAVFLKRALMASTPGATFAWWAALGLAVSLAVAPLALGRTRWRSELRLIRVAAATYALLAITTGLMQAATIVVLGGFAVGPALALFQTSALISVLLGHAMFREPHLAQRLAGSAVMTAGAILIVAGR